MQTLIIILMIIGFLMLIGAILGAVFDDAHRPAFIGAVAVLLIVLLIIPNIYWGRAWTWGGDDNPTEEVAKVFDVDDCVAPDGQVVDRTNSDIAQTCLFDPAPDDTSDTPGQANATFEMGCGPSKDVGAVKALIGLDIVCLGTEYDAYTWRSAPIAVDATCPEGWICTLHLSNDKIIVTETPDKYKIVAGTFRRKEGYPSSDAVHDACALLVKEQAFGASQNPSFPVFPQGFDCEGTASVDLNQPSPSGDELMVSVEALFTEGVPGSLELIEENTAVKFRLGEGQSCAAIYIPSEMIVDVWDGKVATVVSDSTATICEATFRSNS